MKKIIDFVLVFVFISAAASLPLASAPVEPDQALLEGINYVRIRCRFNGATYYKGYKDLKGREIQEFNAEAVETALKESGIPISKEKFRALYDRMESLLKTGGVRIVAIRQDDSTIIPFISLSLEAKAVGSDRELVVVLLTVTVSRWISTWVGTRNIQSPMIAWWKHKIMAVKPEELDKSIDTAAGELLATFLAQWQEANKEEEKEEGSKK
jgi:hypothetical protein